MTPPIWLRADEQKEAVRALEIFHAQLDLAVEDPLSWKWALVALHNAVQNFVIASMSGRSALGGVKPFIAGRWLESVAAQIDRQAPVVPDYFLELYARMKEETGYRPAVEIDIAVARLNEHRNAFIHYSPSSWLLHVNDLPVMSLECLHVIEALGWKSGSISWQDRNLAERARDVYDACVTRIEELDIKYRV